jgi:hypothetical protein
MEVIGVRSLKVDRVFLLGYLIGLPLLLVAYMLSPEEYPVLALDDLQQGQSKTEVLNFLYTSLLTKITTWYQGMVGCVFGIFSVMALLTAKLPQKIRIVVAVIGELIVLTTAFVIFKTVTTYMLICVVEQSYPVNATRHPNMLTWFQELNNAIATGPFAILPRVSNLMPRDVILVFGGSLAFFIWPTLYVIAELYLHGVRDSTIKDERS